MIRNTELMKAILSFVETNQKQRGGLDVELDGYTDFEIAYHIALLSEAKYLEVPREFDKIDLSNKYVSRLTWAGHNFLAKLNTPISLVPPESEERKTL